MQRLIFTDNADAAISGLTAGCRVFVVADDNVERHVMPRLPSLAAAPRGVIPPGEENKTLDTAAALWREMVAAGVTRQWTVVNVGGGMVTDLGGFCAATFMRGVRFINVPTTLLGAVDAAVGGKTGIDLDGLKNMVGVFAPADAVVFTTAFFDTLPRRELLSGYGEMIKHALLGALPLPDGGMPTLDELRESVAVKTGIVSADPLEKGLRRALNLGHTAGHAIEELSIMRGRPVAHGYAVAWGLVVALVLSRLKQNFDASTANAVIARLRELYGPMPAGCRDFARLVELMGHDKKNREAGDVRFSLLTAPGRPSLDVPVGRDELLAALEIAAQMLGA